MATKLIMIWLDQGWLAAVAAMMILLNGAEGSGHNLYHDADHDSGDDDDDDDDDDDEDDGDNDGDEDALPHGAGGSYDNNDNNIQLNSGNDDP